LSSEAGREWIVLLEAAEGGRGAPIGRAEIGLLAASWPNPAPTVLYSEHRYALQVPVRAPSPPAALARAMDLWDCALRRTLTPHWDLVRAEVVTPEELDAELAGVEGVAPPACECHDPSRGTSERVGDDLLRRALYDTITGLPGREAFLDDVRRRLAGGDRPMVHAVMVVDVDGLATERRHEAKVPPAEVLVELATRLSGAVRTSDVVARIGAARFALLVGVRAEAQADAVARRVVAGVRLPLPSRGFTLQPRPSVGMATASGTGDADQLILRAEQALGAAQAAGGNCHRKVAAAPPRGSLPEPLRRDAGRCGTKGRLAEG